MGPVVRFVGARILRDHEFQREDLWVRDGIILDPQKIFWAERKEVRQEHRHVATRAVLSAHIFRPM
jgi:hypothetical protein